MKKYIYNFMACLGLGIAMLNTSCSQLEEEFYNPDKITAPTPELFFASSLQQEHLFRMGYGPTYHYMRGFTKMLGLGINPALTTRTQSNDAIQTWTGWSGEPFNWDVFKFTNVRYTKDINAMKLVFNGMSEEEKATYKVYILCSDIVKSYGFQRSTDLYDDIPFSEVGGAFQEKFYAKYDTQESIYAAIMEMLKTSAAGLETYKFSSEAQRVKFESSDLLNDGNLDKWIRMANSLRLRMAMRLCHVKPDVAKATIKELVDGGKLVLESDHNIEFRERSKLNVYQDLFYRGFDERGWDLIAPRFFIQDVLNYYDVAGNDVDPRLYVLFQPNRDGKYIGFTETQDNNEYLNKYYTKDQLDSIYNNTDAPIGSWDRNRLVTRYNRGTFMNFDMDFPVIQATEVRLLLAEAAVRWPETFGGINAGSELKSAIVSSTEFYYNLNMTNNYNEGTMPDLQHVPENAYMKKLDREYLDAYILSAENRFNQMDKLGKLNHILHQKMLHYNVLYPYEVYNEVRRLIKDNNGELPIKPVVNVYFCERFYYPSDEANTNTANFEAVKAKNNYYTPVWWSGRTVPAQNPNHTVPLN